MKHLLHILAFTFAAFVAASCEYEIGEVDESSKHQLIINALMTAQGQDNYVELHLTGTTKTTLVRNAQVKIFINGSLAEEATSDTCIYKIKSLFASGDKVRIEASDGQHSASAETTVPETVTVVSVDSADVRFGNENYTRYFIKIKDPSSLKETKYYRLSVVREQHKVNGAYYHDNELYYVSYSTDIDNKYSYYSDIALSEGMSKKSKDYENMDAIELVEEVKNVFGLFRSSYFSNGEYTLNIDLKEWWGHDVKGDAEDIHFKIRSIPESEYYYLQAVSVFQNYEEGVMLTPAPIVPSNVKGGTGIFSVSAMAETTISRGKKLEIGDKIW
ncbi:MAG: DUF4249 family protein [Bacteroidaceae bacterium]|nr:DUF4249 family protein [Bacteroidaceae bacterium]